MSVLRDLGKLHVVTGLIDASAGASVTVDSPNDNSLSVARTTATVAGDYTLTFGHEFLSPPHVFAMPIDTFAATDGVVQVSVVSRTATDVQFNIATSGATATAPAASDHDFSFVAIGARNI